MAYLDEEDLSGHARAWKEHLKEGNFYLTKEIAKTFGPEFLKLLRSCGFGGGEVISRIAFEHCFLGH